MFFLVLKPQCTAKWHVFYSQNHEILKPAISGLYIRFHPVYRPRFYFTRKQMTAFYWQQKLPDNREYIKIQEWLKLCLLSMFFLVLKPQCTAKWHVFYIRNRHISVSSFVYKYDQWPHDSYMTGRVGVTYLMFMNYRRGMCFRVSSIFVLSILFWFPQRTHYFWRVFRFLFMEHKQDYSVTSENSSQE
jgi:hypothetical protein